MGVKEDGYHRKEVVTIYMQKWMWLPRVGRGVVVMKQKHCRARGQEVICKTCSGPAVMKATSVARPSRVESRRDQVEGGGLGSYEEVGRFCGSRRDQEKVGGLDRQVSPEEIRSREVELRLKVGLLLLQLFPNGGATDIVFETLFRIAVGTATA